MQLIAKFCIFVLVPPSACYAASESPYFDISIPGHNASVERMIPCGGQRDNRD